MMRIFYMIVLLMCGLTIFIFMILVIINNDIGTGSWLDNKPKEKYKKSRSNYIPETQKIPVTNLPIYYRRRKEPPNKLYSEISQRDVLMCCYNAARLNDRYCVCGRGVIYPKFMN